MLPQLGMLTTGIKFKVAFLAAALFLYSEKSGWVEMISSPIFQSQPAIAPAVTKNINNYLDAPGLWNYLRAGLNFVEASGRDVAIDYLHPGGIAYGPLALTRIAIRDVIQRCAAMSDYTIDDILSDKGLYEKCAKLYADLLLRHYLKLGTGFTSREKLFDILQKAWFLGPGLYKNGARIPRSRQVHAREYMAHARPS